MGIAQDPSGGSRRGRGGPARPSTGSSSVEGGRMTGMAMVKDVDVRGMQHCETTAPCLPSVGLVDHDDEVGGGAIGLDDRAPQRFPGNES